MDWATAWNAAATLHQRQHEAHTFTRDLLHPGPANRRMASEARHHERRFEDAERRWTRAIEAHADAESGAVGVGVGG